jgi:ABC-type transport system involved in cytochrome c biogenesis permease subunit
LVASSVALLEAVRPSSDPARRTQWMVRGTGVGFALFTVMMCVGAVYSFLLFADWYRWEIVGTSTFIGWLGYGAVLHAYLLFGWTGRRLAWATLGLLPVLLFAFWSWSVFSGTYHYFDLIAIRAM